MTKAKKTALKNAVRKELPKEYGFRLNFKQRKIYLFDSHGNKEVHSLVSMLDLIEPEKRLNPRTGVIEEVKG